MSKLIKLFKEDRLYIDKWNLKQNLEYKIDLDLPPEPFIGNYKKAKIFVFLLNPGITYIKGFKEPLEIEHYKLYPNLLKDINNSNFMLFNKEYPFHKLNPNYRLYSGFQYFYKIFKQYINKEIDYKILSHKICCFQYHSWHSLKFKKRNLLPSQKYMFDIIRKIIINNKDCVFIFSRGIKIWSESLNLDFNDYKDRIVYLKNSRVSVISKNNLNQRDFNKINKILI